jgi:predicted O-methyltransferase YrrM
VYNSFRLGFKYLKYYFSAANGKGHGIHSPFVFNFILDVLNNRKNIIPPVEISNLHEGLKNNQAQLEIDDLGAGSRIQKTKKRSVGQLAKTAVKPKKYSHLLFRLVKKYDPKTIVELGTSLGITTSYLAAAAPTSQVITIEGSEAIREYAQNNFQHLNLKNIRSLQGNFDEVLPSLLEQLQTIDLAYIDGNHRYEPTINYFKQFLKKKNNNTILIFDDIHWSAEMEKAWAEIQRHPAVQSTIDVFFLGFVFFRDEFKEKQHFTIRY